MERGGQDAAELLMEAFTRLGVHTERPRTPDDSSNVVLQPGGVLVQVKRYSLVTPDVARRALAAAQSPLPGSKLIVVGDRVTAAARQFLMANDAGYYDLRGHLALTTPVIVINTDVAPIHPRPPRRDALSGRAGLEVALALLSDPHHAPSVREMARTLGRSPSTVSEALTTLKRENLINERGRVVDPQLFWQVAEHWPTERTYLTEVPTPGNSSRWNQPLRLGLSDGDSTGWALTESAAAAALGAALAFRPDQPLDFFVPDELTLRRARSVLGVSTTRSGARCSVRVAPVPAVCAHRIDSPLNALEWPLAQPVFVALDLAQDHGRGREALEAWTPEGTWQRVW